MCEKSLFKTGAYRQSHNRRFRKIFPRLKRRPKLFYFCKVTNFLAKKVVKTKTIDDGTTKILNVKLFEVFLLPLAGSHSLLLFCLKNFILSAVDDASAGVGGGLLFEVGTSFGLLLPAPRHCLLPLLLIRAAAEKSFSQLRRSRPFFLFKKRSSTQLRQLFEQRKVLHFRNTES